MAETHLPLYDTGVLAHQGGWDEILLVAAPIAAIVVVLWRATLRVDRQNADQQDLQRQSGASDVGADASKPSN